MKRASDRKSPTLNIIYLRYSQSKLPTEVTIPMNDIPTKSRTHRSTGSLHGLVRFNIHVIVVAELIIIRRIDDVGIIEVQTVNTLS